jgi:hypothetical protein
MSTGAFTLADIDKPAAQTGRFSADDIDSSAASQTPSFGEGMAHASFFRNLSEQLGKVADWAEGKASQKDVENLSSIARTGKGNPMEAYSPRAGYDILARATRMLSGTTDPKNVLATTGVALANTNLITGIPVDAALVAHGGYGVVKNAPAAFSGDPEAAERMLLSGSEAAGGAVGVGNQAQAFRGAASGTAKRLYQSALKPSTTLTPAERSGIIQTGLEQKIHVSEAGADRLSALLTDLQAKTKAIIATNPDAPINKFAVASRLNAPAARAANQVNPVGDLNAIARAGNEFLREQPAEIPAARAQDLKTGTYQSLGDKAYGELKGAQIEGQKALARGLKEELQNIFPELQNLNPKQAKLYDLQPELHRAIGRIDNHDLISLGTPMTTTAGTAIANSSKVGLAAGILKTVLDNPMLKSRLAIALNAAGKGKVPVSAANARIGAVVSSLAASANQQGP